MGRTLMLAGLAVAAGVLTYLGMTRLRESSPTVPPVPPALKAEVETKPAILKEAPARAEAAGPKGVQAPAGSAPEGMVWIPGQTFTMGTDDPESLPHERPAHQVTVDGFWMDVTEVTNRQFRAFVDATGYVTTAERAPDWEELKAQLPPGTPKPPDDQLVPGSLVFTPPAGAVPLDDVSQWWQWVPGANWKHPLGPDSNLDGLDDHPVVQVSWDDAAAYAKWAGKRLPTEAEWECAARGGLKSQRYMWGETFRPEGKWMANIWQGHFPDRNAVEDQFERTAPVKSFPANGYGLYDMSGNVWEWTTDWYRSDTFVGRSDAPCTNPAGPERSFDPNDPYAQKRVVRGGSFLCNDSYCSSYRTTGRMSTDPKTSLSHTGFRCVMSPTSQGG